MNFISQLESKLADGTRTLTKKYNKEGKVWVEYYKWCTCNGGSWRLEAQYFE